MKLRLDGRVTPKPGTVFVYSGQGSQWAGMARQLLADEPVFADALAEIEPVFVEQVGFSLHDIIAGGETITIHGMDICEVRGTQLSRDEAYMDTLPLTELMAALKQ